MLGIRDLILGMSTALGVGLATAITLPFVVSGSYVTVQALDASGAVIGTAPAIKV
jgi:hypothetical protein